MSGLDFEKHGASTINTEDMPAQSVADNNTEQLLRSILRELRKINTHFELMTDQTLEDGDYDVTN